MHSLLATALLLAAAPQIDPRLTGTWATGGEAVMVLRADGTGQTADGPVRWAATAGVLSLTASDGSGDRAAYQVAGDVLTLTLPGGSQQLTRLAGAGAGPAAAPRSEGAQASPARSVRFNGRPLRPDERQTLERLERQIGRIPDGDYWYDPRTGASGRWGGPALAFLPAGLALGGEAPANASGGGRGALTGVFVNGRELHPVDVAGLQGLVGQVHRGRWWVDAQGNYGLEGGPLLGNLVALARARQQAGSGGGTAWSKRYEGATPRSNLNLASDGTTTCVSVSGYSRCTGE